MKVFFQKTGYNYLRHWVPELRIYSSSEVSFAREISTTMGRGTYKAVAIDKYILEGTFLDTKKRILVKDIRRQKLDLLKGMLQINSPFFFRKALKENWSLKQLKTNVLFKIL